MWKDLEERSEALKRNPVVKHLIETPTQSFNDGIVFPEPRELDRDYSPEQIFAPLSADSSQFVGRVSGGQREKFRALRPTRNGQKPDDHQHDRAMSGREKDSSLRGSENGCAGGSDAQTEGDRVAGSRPCDEERVGETACRRLGIDRRLNDPRETDRLHRILTPEGIGEVLEPVRRVVTAINEGARLPKF
jgi:hypothetical protein